MKISLGCLRPITQGLITVLSIVLGSALLFDLTAFSAVIIVMPVLLLIYFFQKPNHIRKILASTRTWLQITADDILVISIAILVGFLVNNSVSVSLVVDVIFKGRIPGWFALTMTPFLMTVASFLGIHPIITSRTLLTMFSGGKADLHPALLMHGPLVGWTTGMMSSVSSMSVISCANLYQVPSSKLAFGQNLWVAIFFSIGTGLILSLANVFLY